MLPATSNRDPLALTMLSACKIEIYAQGAIIIYASRLIPPDQDAKK